MIGAWIVASQRELATIHLPRELSFTIGYTLTRIWSLRTHSLSMTEHIKTTINGPVVEIMLDRAERKNALNREMYTALTAALIEAETLPAVRTVLILGSGGCFTSGNDLADFTQISGQSSQLSESDNVIFDFLQTLNRFSKPVVVSVEGYAVGIGTTLLLHADLVYCHPDTVFKLPFVQLGLCPEFASSLLLPRLAGYVKAAEWLLLGDPFSAGEARHVGLVNAVLDEPLKVAREQCQKLAKLPPQAVRAAKKLLRQPLEQPVQQVMVEEVKIFSQLLQGEEFKEAAMAFFEKRAPDFSRFE